MIASSQIDDPSPHVRQRGRNCRVKTLAFDSYIVTPPEKGKEKRLVHFDVSDAGAVKIECVSIDTGSVCEANSFSKMCSHVQAAVLRLEGNIRREEKRQRKAKADLTRSRRVAREVKRHPSQKALL